MKIRKLGMISLIGFASLLPFGAFADDQQGLLLPGITGTETIDGVSGLIPIEGFSGGAGNNILVLRTPDAFSPLLEQAAATERQFASATVYEFDSVGTAPVQLSYIYSFSNVVATSYVLLTGGFAAPEQFGLSYSSHSISAVPEPATWLSMMVGLAALGTYFRTRPTPLPRFAIVQRVKGLGVKHP